MNPSEYEIRKKVEQDIDDELRQFEEPIITPNIEDLSMKDLLSLCNQVKVLPVYDKTINCYYEVNKKIIEEINKTIIDKFNSFSGEYVAKKELDKFNKKSTN